MKPKFKVGDKIRIIKPGHCVAEVNGAVGMIGEVVYVSSSGNTIEVKSPQFVRMENVIWSFTIDQVEHVEDILMIDPFKWNCECKICGSPAYQGLQNIECSKGCK